jgi:hypothetical protein
MALIPELYSRHERKETNVASEVPTAVVMQVTIFWDLAPSSLYVRPPLWSSGQSSWLHIRRPGFNSSHYQKKKKVAGLERGPLSLVSTTEELLDRKVAAPV